MGRRLPWILVLVVAAVLLWQFGNTEDEPAAPDDPPADASANGPVRPPPSPLAGSGATATAADGPGHAKPGGDGAGTEDVEPPAVADAGAPAKKPPPTPKYPSTVPLGNVFVPRTDWKEASGEDVLRELARAGDKPLSVTVDAQAIVSKIRFTLESENQPVARLLDLVTQPYGLYWTIRRGAIEVYVDDAD